MSIESAKKHYEVAYLAVPARLSVEKRKHLISALWCIWDSKKCKLSQHEYSEVMQAMCAIYSVYFEKTAIAGMPDEYDDDVDRWFFDVINSEAITFDRFRDMCGVCLNFSKSHD